jgi:hypothetical protein
MTAENTRQPKSMANDPYRRARYLLSIACLVKDAAKHDELQQKAKCLLAQAHVNKENCDDKRQ